MGDDSVERGLASTREAMNSIPRIHKTAGMAACTCAWEGETGESLSLTCLPA